jgi:hypothetical protein
MKLPNWVAVLIVLFVNSNIAQAYYINSYAVANHRSCGSSNLPGTIRELNRFFNSNDFPEDASKNVYYKDSNVKASDWTSEGDYYENAEATSGMDGIDSALISYIASHGATSRARYTANSGGSRNGGCDINTSEMNVGNSVNRYLILSTCQGLKIGTGDNPSRRGEDPSLTWATPAQGLNCIYGYSNNMVDSSGYGEYFLKNIASSDETLSEAFLRASRQVSYSNIPAVMCFGTDENNARFHLENDRRFTVERNGGTTSVWKYADNKRMQNTFAIPQMEKFAKVIVSEKANFNLEPIVKTLLGSKFAEVNIVGDRNGYRSSKGVIIVDSEAGVLHWEKSGASYGSEFKIDDKSTVEIAKSFLKRNKIITPKMPLVVSYIIEHGSTLNKKKILTDKTVIFHQLINGLMPLGTSGSIEVKVNGTGVVVKVVAAPLRLKNVRKPSWVAVKDAGVIGNRIKIAKSRLQTKISNAEIKFVDVRFGYDTGSYYDSKDRSRVVVEVLLEATKGKYARRYIEKIPL